ncbi:MAG: hypothetical protein K2N63_07740 [Lachnospiraceae bacterium]|nr:hypothetical protein [Lachnospiraceae bacterium]
MCGKKREEGVITAFFALVFLLTIAMLLCMAESARLGACGRTAQSILRLGTKSLLGSYDLSLYENYHIFGRSVGEKEGAGKELAGELSWYLQQNLSGRSLLSMRADKTEITGLSALTKEDGAMFYAQAVQYEKYREMEEFAEWLIKAVRETKKAEKTGVLLQKSLDAEQGAAKVEETINELLGCLDGFVVEDGSLVRGIFGKIKTTGSFAKKLVPYGAGEWLLAGNNELYEAQRGNYTDPLQELKEIAENQKRVGNYESSIASMWQQYGAISLSMEQLRGEEEIDEEKLAQLSMEQNRLLDRINAAESQLSACRNSMRRQLSSIREDIKKAETGAKKALELLDRLETERVLAREGLLAYAIVLPSFAGQVPNTVYQEMAQQNRELLKRFMNQNSLGIIKDISAMREALQHNIKLYNAAFASLAMTEEHAGDIINVLSTITAAEANLSGLKLHELVLDYGSVRVPQRSNPYIKLAKKFFKYGVLSLVVADEKEIGKGVIRRTDLPSGLYMGEGEERIRFSFKQLFKETREEEAFEISFGDSDGFLKKAAEELTEEYLYISYLKRHFASYADGNVPAVLSGNDIAEGLLYQLEYIIAGEESDKDNLSDIAVKIFLVRFAMNLAVIFASQECRAEVKEAATAVAGFTGIGALVVFVELLIAMLWAAECALTETSGLFSFGEVSFFPTAKSLAISFGELSRVSKSFWQQKAKRYTESGAGGILKTYSEYLYLFLALEKPGLRTMRTMDVVQQVMQLKYDNTFLMQNCIYAVETGAEFTVPYLFLPIVGILSGEGIKQEKKAGISY